jgi:hypothetical protein
MACVDPRYRERLAATIGSNVNTPSIHREHHVERRPCPFIAPRPGGGAFEQFAFAEVGSGVHQGDQVWGVDRPPAACAASITLYAMAIPAACDPGPLVTFVLKHTVAKADSIGFVVRKWIQCSAGYL